MPFAIEPAVLQAVPHRPPILRVHRVVAVQDGTAVIAGSEPTGPGAVPWAAGAIEGFAQSAAVMLGHRGSGVIVPQRGMLVAVKRFAVVAEPPAGAEIHYHVRLVRRLGPTALIAGHAEVAAERVASGELTLWLTPVDAGS